MDQHPSEAGNGQPTVLVVDDEPGLADLYAAWLADEYNTRTAYGGHSALETFDESVDVVLLDRRMDDRSGDDVLTEIRRQGLDCKVAMVTAVDPDFDIIEMGFDDYLSKPVSQDDLKDVVESLLAVKTYDETVNELYRLLSKWAALETRKSATQLERSDEYQELEARIPRLMERSEAAMETALDRDPEVLFSSLDVSPAGGFNG